ncbi:MAG: transporter substrate-binding domain-containing protein, partial [bacterium]|nr:transporter substrate-binding domain-containing protein [Candidatus Colisoma equi]
MRLECLSLALVSASCAFLGCSQEAGDGPSPIRSIADLRGRRCGLVTGTVMHDVVDGVQKGVIYDAFNDTPSMVEALRLGKVDAVPLDTVVLRCWAANFPGDFEAVASIAANPYGYFFQKGSPLRQRVNAILAEMKASGVLPRIVSKWCDAPDMDGIALEPFP